METSLVFLLVILGSSYSCEGYKILVVFPIPGKSHGILGDGYVRHLLDAGHEVTYVTPFPKNNTNPKLRQIDVSNTIGVINFDFMSIQKILDNEVQPSDFLFLFSLLLLNTQTVLEAPDMVELINDPTQSFDLVIIEYMFSEALVGLAAVFDCPYIWSVSLEPHWMILKMIHEASNSAYVPDIQSTDIPPLTFVQRAKGLLLQISFPVLQYFFQHPRENELYEKHFAPALARRGRVLTDWREITYNASFLLSNSHVTLSQPLSLPPNAKEIGGYHIEPKTKSLPKDLQDLMDNAEHGVVYFSMGSNWKSKDIPDVIKQDILKVFSGLKQTVIWKFEEELPNLPKNVHILKWAPQPSILAHPNIRLFITHGGLLSVTETVYYGVPIVAIPITADQFINAQRAFSKGLGLQVQLSYNMGPALKTAVDEVLSTDKFLKRAKQLSMIYHDRLVPPGKELVHWVEHVVRTGGAPHLRSPALMLPWYQKMYLDLALLALACLLFLKYAVNNILMLNKGTDLRKKIN